MSGYLTDRDSLEPRLRQVEPWLRRVEQPRLSGVESRLPSGGESRPLRRLPYGLGCCAACSLLLLVWCWLQGSSSLEQPLCCCGLHHAGSPRVSARPCVAVSWLLLGSTQIAIFGRGSP